MRRLVAVVLLLVSLPAAVAESSPPDVYTTHNVNVIGIIAAGQQTWYVYYPTEIEGPGEYQISVTVDSTQAASATLTLTAAATVTSGCTLGALVVTDTWGDGVTAYIPVTVAGENCHGTSKLQFATAGGTELANLQFGFQLQQHDLGIQTEWDPQMEGFLGVGIGFLIALLLVAALLCIRVPGFLGKFVGMPIALLVGLLAIASVVQSSAPQAVLFGALFGLVGFLLIGLALWRWYLERKEAMAKTDEPATVGDVEEVL